jgi:hypothetical protein
MTRYARDSLSTSAADDLLIAYVGVHGDELRQDVDHTTVYGQVIVNQGNDPTDIYWRRS